MTKEKNMNEKMIEACARAAHECNRAYCIAIGDNSQLAWDDVPDWQRSSVINGVKGVLAGNTPEQSHEGWLAEKKAAGWKFGAVKDPDKKEHPCFHVMGGFAPGAAGEGSHILRYGQGDGKCP